jgi:hypothetical protein
MSEYAKGLLRAAKIIAGNNTKATGFYFAEIIRAEAMTDTKPSDTPRTDAESKYGGYVTKSAPVVSAEFARKLERELTRIQSAEMPEPLNVFFEHGETGRLVIENSVNVGGIRERYVSKIDYDALKAYAQRKATTP